MTAPIAHGYPDWGRYVASADKRYDSFSFNNQNGTVTSGVYFVGDVPYISFFTFVAIQNATCVISWYPDAAISPSLRDDTIELTPLSTCFINLPVRGPWLSIQWIPNAVPFSVFGDIISTHSPNAPTGLFGTGNVLISETNRAVGAGATVTVDAARVYPGPAIWNVFPTPATWVANVDALRADGTTTRLDTINSTRGFESRRLYLPLCTIRLAVTNTSGVAGAFNATLMAKPLYGGN